MGAKQITALCVPFPDRVIHKNPSGGGSYVKHSTVQQRIMDVLGLVDFELVEIIRGHVAGKAPDPKGTSARAKAGTPALENAVVGVVVRMTAVVDGKTVVVEEAGDCEAPHNWPHDGARMKDAMSDGFKRCAMRLGVGLHLWSQDDFYIARKLIDRDQAEEA
jgi:hypothetical protein